MSKTTGPDIGSKLLDKKVISEDQLNIAIKERERLGGNKSLGVILDYDLNFHQIIILIRKCLF